MIKLRKHKYWVLAPATRRAVNDAALRATYGVSLRANWRDVNPSPGEWDWSFWDHQIERITKAKKRFMLRLLPGEHAPRHAYEREHNGAPVVWDRVYLNRWSNAVKRMGDRYASHPRLVAVHMNGPARAGEFYIPNDQWLLPDYSINKIYSAWNRICRVFANTFHCPLVLNVSRVAGRADVERDAKGIVDRCLGIAGYDRIICQFNSLAAKTNIDWWVPRLVHSAPRWGYQDVSPSGNVDRYGGTFAQATAKMKKGWIHREIYQGDIYEI